mmetsp:Transcript_35985/g.113838  ORF Transcript_35985/g.113838 Transcript_35985/m.113838 type:complete len:176 (-) Transcript_35985:1390-1917(-)
MLWGCPKKMPSLRRCAWRPGLPTSLPTCLRTRARASLDGRFDTRWVGLQMLRASWWAYGPWPVQAAANVSVVRGTLTPERAKAMSSRGRGNVDIEGGQEYSAAAMSLVFHPASPRVPTLRADVRLFEVGGSVWYGGGCDLTPAYLEEEDAREFHGYEISKLKTRNPKPQALSPKP